MPRILIVEDSPTQARELSFILEDAGFEVETAPDAERGFARLAEGKFDLVLSDLLLPGDSGFDLCRKIKADPRLARVPVVVCTSQADPLNVMRGLEAGADGFMTKDHEPDELVGRLRRALARPPSTSRAEGTSVVFLNQEFRLNAGREQLLDILVTAFEDVIHLNRAIQQEKERTNELLHVILPDEVIVELKTTNYVRPRRYDNVAVLFADLVGFTHYCEKRAPEEVVAVLQQLVESWEQIALRHGVEKIKTIGDAFMAAAGLLKRAENPVLQCVRCGLEMIEVAKNLATPWDLRVGINAGQVVAGVLGHRQYLFDLWGDTVNAAARLESHGVPGAITMSVGAWRQIEHLARAESLGVVPVKGKGDFEIIRFLGFREGANS